MYEHSVFKYSNESEGSFLVMWKWNNKIDVKKIYRRKMYVPLTWNY